MKRCLVAAVQQPTSACSGGSASLRAFTPAFTPPPGVSVPAGTGRGLGHHGPGITADAAVPGNVVADNEVVVDGRPPPVSAGTEEVGAQPYPL